MLWIQKIFNFFLTFEAFINFLNLYSIFLILRYSTIFSIFFMIGVFVLPFITEIKTNLKLLIAFYIIPAIFQLGILYFYNIESHNEFINFNNQEIFAFQVSNIQLEYIFMMCYLGLTINYLKYFLRKSSKKKENLKKSEKNLNLFFILIIIVVRNSDIVSFIILFFISMYTVNLIHSILVIFFFVYLIIKVTYFPKINALSFVEMKLLYWKFLIVYLDIILFVKYSLLFFIFLKNFLGIHGSCLFLKISSLILNK